MISYKNHPSHRFTFALKHVRHIEKLTTVTNFKTCYKNIKYKLQLFIRNMIIMIYNGLSKDCKFYDHNVKGLWTSVRPPVKSCLWKCVLRKESDADKTTIILWSRMLYYILKKSRLAKSAFMKRIDLRCSLKRKSIIRDLTTLKIYF